MGRGHPGQGHLGRGGTSAASSSSPGSFLLCAPAGGGSVRLAVLLQVRRGGGMLPDAPSAREAASAQAGETKTGRPGRSLSAIH